MMMFGKDFLKSHVLSWRRTVYSDWEDVTSSGRTFQVFGPATGEARQSYLTGKSPKLLKHTKKYRPFACSKRPAGDDPERQHDHEKYSSRTDGHQRLKNETSVEVNSI